MPTRTLAFAMLAGTFVTIAGFVPIGFARSTAGEYTFSIFAVVTIALLVSWLVAVLFAPVLCMALLSKPEAGAADAPPGLTLRLYRGFLVRAMRARWITVLSAIAVFAAAVAAMGLVPQQFFPPSDRVELLVDLSLPQNASIHGTEAAATRLDDILQADPDIDHWSTYVGRGAIRFYLPLNVQLPNPFFAQAVIVAKDIEARKRLQPRLERMLAEEFPSAIGRVYPLELGPPVGWPIQYRIAGPDLGQTREIAWKLAQVLATNSEIRRINFDWMEPAREIRIRIDQDKARLLGLSSQTVAASLDAAVTGVPITQVRDGIYLIDVVARSVGGQRMTPARLRTLELPLADGRTIPLNQIASFDYAQEHPLVWRRNRVPTLTVQADIAPGSLPEEVVQSLAPAVAGLGAELPRPYRIELGGVAEESAQSRASVLAVVPVMLFIMLAVLMMQLKSFQRLFIVLSVIPLSLIGVVGALLVSGRAMGFVAILGILSLIGMIAKNAVILVGQIESERAAGLHSWDAVIEASSSRFRPIALTAVSTVLGMIPIAVTVFWGPMAVAIMGGLLVATVLTLIFLPALYVAWFRIEPREGTADQEKEEPAEVKIGTAA